MSSHGHYLGDQFLQCSMPGELHMNICLSLIRDKRRIHSSSHFQSCPLLCSQMIGNSHCQSDHCSRTAEPVVTQTLARSADTVVTHNRPQDVRFEINNNNDNRYNNDDDDCGGSNGVGVGLCCSGFEFRD